MSNKQNKEKHKQNRTHEEDVTVSSLSKDSTAADDSDYFSEIDTNEQVGNVDTLVDDENLENKYDKVITFAPGEG